MNASLLLALSAAVFILPSLRADDTVKAAVFTRQFNSEVKEPKAMQMGARRTFETGEVYEVASQKGRTVELKVDGTRVALVSVDVVRVRSCTSAELAEAQGKFNSVLSNEAQKASRKKKSDEIKQMQNRPGSQPNVITTVIGPDGRPIVGMNAGQLQKDDKKAQRESREALVKEALAWAAQGQQG